jgi:hypothetical protein
MELVLRFLLGGLAVSAFAAAGELFKPKTFSGLFGAAPAVAIATLAIAHHKHGGAYAATEARAMLLGGAAMLVYTSLCIALTRRHHVPVWLSAAGAWISWAAVAFALFAVASGVVATGGV